MCNLSERYIRKGLIQGLEQGREEGREEGIEKGIEKGREETLRKNIISAIEEGFDTDTIIKVFKVSADYVKQLMEEIS